ncbi:MAG: VOC family protein [Acidimicrobiales bacterium]
MGDNIPDGLHTVTPYFTVLDADLLVAFLGSAFGGQVVKEDRDRHGRIRHARVRIGDSIIMLNEASAEYPANDSQIHILVADVDAAFDRAVNQGASVIMEPNLRRHGDRMAGVVDPCGNRWWIASPQRA